MAGNKKIFNSRRTVDHFTDTAQKTATTGKPINYKKMTVAERRKHHKDINEGNIPLTRGVTYGGNKMAKRRAALAKKTAQRRGTENKAHRDL